MGRYESFEAFWPFYVHEHRNASCRRLHFVGTGLVILGAALAAWRSPWWLLACPIAGYGFAWVGHFGFEKNRPATFSYPLWSLRGDFRMFRLMATGKMASEIAHAEALFAASPEDTFTVS